jgi:Fic family protein
MPTARETGRYQRIRHGEEEVAAFVPHPLPPASPALVLDAAGLEGLGRAEQALARLELAGELVPSVDWLLYAFVRKEAVVSSQIEGTQATLVDLLTFEAEATGNAERELDVEEVTNYLDALEYAMREVSRPAGLPISVRLLNEIHRRLMKGVRGADKQPGEIRRSQNWIGGSRPGRAAFVPPPANLVGEGLGDLEKYVHARSELPPLVRAGLVHVQFETIHPYLDGNGRIGRLLIMLLLREWGLLKEPLLYLSLYFKRHRAEYYRRLAAVRTEGDWEGWTTFFLKGVATIADEAVAGSRALFALIAADRARVLGAPTATVVSARVFEQLPRHPILTIPGLASRMEITKPTAGKAVAILESLGILREISGRLRDRTFAYREYLDRLKGGTELAGGGGA